MAENIPYVHGAGTLETMLEKMKNASVPDKFSQDFVETKLAMKGGTPRSIIPFIKKMGLVSPDGTPTERYKEFRNPDKSGHAIAMALKDAYSVLFEMNERAHELDSKKLKGLMMEATGAAAESASLNKAITTFNTLKKLATFSHEASKPKEEELSIGNTEPSKQISLPISNNYPPETRTNESINLSYTINLNLPSTTDIEVFNAIFKSLRKHLLQG